MENLKKVLLFEEFTEGELAALKKIAKISSLNPQQTAFSEGDPGDGLFILNYGTLQLTKNTKAGDQEIIATLGSGDYLGEMSLFDKKNRSASGKALERSEISVLPYRDLITLLDGNPAIAAKFYKNLAKGIARRLQHMNEDVAFLKSYLKAKK